MDRVSSSIAGCVFGFVVMAAATPAYAQPYPHKPIRMIIPFPPAGATDILARVVSQKLGESVKQQVVVDNRPGAGGTIGSRLATDAQADGYTIIAAAKAKPGQFNFGSSGIGTQFHLSGELLKLLAGINIVHIPYKGTALVYPDMFSGQIAILFDVPLVALPHIKSGRVRALGVSGRKRAAVLPEVQTIAEAGVAGYDADIWFGLWGPARMPREHVRVLHAEVAKLLELSDVKQRLASLGAEPVGSTPDAFAAFVKAEISKWEKVVKASGARAE